MSGHRPEVSLVDGSDHGSAREVGHGYNVGIHRLVRAEPRRPQQLPSSDSDARVMVPLHSLRLGARLGCERAG